ncbi:RlpA-like double-psi beta-barrel-protein domain-containing protein-containing protein [Aspergillus egyptiacus]|nr:RlpA-like double-psi beta-barrel-protein domain-containing protein-containing protein [Aspergillus egyptiacus]
MSPPPMTSPLLGVPKRKPLPDLNVAAAATLDSTSDIEKTIIEPIFAPATTTAATTQPPRRSQLHLLKQKWILLSTKKKRIILIAFTVSLVLIALIVGLAVGLTQRHGKGSNLPLPTSNGGPYTGDLTYYDPGLGSCGITSTAEEKVCAVSHVVFDAALTSSNPNENQLCGLRLRIRRGEKSVDVKVVDRCPGCAVNDLDVSPAVFEELGDLAEGRVLVDWAWLDKTPVAMG